MGRRWNKVDRTGIIDHQRLACFNFDLSNTEMAFHTCIVVPVEDVGYAAMAMIVANGEIKSSSAALLQSPPCLFSHCLSIMKSSVFWNQIIISWQWT
jgi:hypothetical protein